MLDKMGDVGAPCGSWFLVTQIEQIANEAPPQTDEVYRLARVV